MIPIVGYKNCTLNSRLQRLGQSSEALPILRYSHTCTSSIKLHACCIINLLVTISRSFMARRKSEQVASAEKHLVERVRLFFKKERRAKHRISLNRVTDRLVAATGLGKTTLAKIHTEFLSSQQFQTPQKKHVK